MMMAATRGAVVVLAMAMAMAVPVLDVRAQTSSPAAEQEVVPLGEEISIGLIVRSIEDKVNAAYAKGERPAMRDAHAKGHGCVKADFGVLADIPEDVKAGVFASPRSYTAWIRFSNGNGVPKNDQVEDARGMAIKVTGVEGPKLLADEADAKTQDFVMINYPVFFIRHASDYVSFTLLSGEGMPRAFFLVHPELARIAKAMVAETVDSVLEQRYFSMTPYLLGDRAIKFGARPVDCESGATVTGSKAPIPDDPDYLRDGMIDWLNTRDACFVFAVQPQTDPSTQPIEDPTVRWDETAAPFIDVASIRIPKQRFDSEAQQAFCEDLSFTPWHALEAHRPVGGINRVRKAAYEAISALRHKLNDTPRVEPTGDETFD